MKYKYQIIIIAFSALILICSLIFDADYMTQMSNAKEAASPGDATQIYLMDLESKEDEEDKESSLPEVQEVPVEKQDMVQEIPQNASGIQNQMEDTGNPEKVADAAAVISAAEELPESAMTETLPVEMPVTEDDVSVIIAPAKEYQKGDDSEPDEPEVTLNIQQDNFAFKSVGDKHPMKNSEDWWPKAKTYIKNTFGVTDGQYNTTETAPSAGNVWCAGLVSRVINNTYPDGKKVAVTESVATLYSEMINSKNFTFIAEGEVSDFADIVTKTRSGDIMLLKKKNKDGSWSWTHTNLITYYGYIYSQGAGGKIRMNTFDNYNQYGAYDPVLSAGYYFYIYRQKASPKVTPTATPKPTTTPKPTATPTPVVGIGSLTKVTKAGYSLYTQDTSKYSLQGAEYTVSNANASKIFYLRTDANGVAHLLDAAGNMTDATSIGNLEMGTYYAWETKSSPGYKLDSECSLNNKKSITISETNPGGTFVSEEIPDVFLMGGIQLIKKPTVADVMSNPNYSLEAEYTVYNSSGVEEKKIKTDKNGRGMVSGLASGTYTVKETTPGRNFELDTNVYTVTIAAGVPGMYVYGGVDYSAVYDPAYYRQANPDLQGFTEAQLLKHFALHGLDEGRRASAYFDVKYYASLNGISTYRGAFEHYLGYGRYYGKQYADYDTLDKSEAGVYGTGSSRPIVLSLEKPGLFDFSLNIFKVDKSSGLSVPSGEGELSGAVFKVSYYGADIDKDFSSEGKKPEREWYLETKQGEDGEYHAYLDEGYLSGKYKSSEILKDSKGNVVMPFGHITIEEVDAPKGYKKTGVIYEGAVQSGEVCHINIDDKQEFDGNITVKEESVRGDIKLTKHDYTDDAPMAGVDFEIKNKATGEILIITTDDEGMATTEGLWMKGAGDESPGVQTDETGALPFGKYLVTELRCDANKGKQLEAPIEISVEEEKIYDAFDPNASEEYITNVPAPEIGTTAYIKDSELKEIPADGEVTLVDKVGYKYLRANTDYTLVGRLMIRDEDGGREEYKINGEPVVVKKMFHTDSDYKKSRFEKSGEEEVIFEGIKVDDLPGKSLVVFETLYLGENIEEVKQYEEYPDEIIFPVEHADINDEGQTLHVADIGTSAHAKDSDSKNIVVDGKVTIVDTVEYKNLTVGKSYKLLGKLYNRLTGDAVTVKGEEITSEKTFVPETKDGTVDVEFIFDLEDEKVPRMVVFEKLYSAEGRLLADHSDISNDKQTVDIVPNEKTTENTTELTTEITTETTTQITTEATTASVSEEKAPEVSETTTEAEQVEKPEKTAHKAKKARVMSFSSPKTGDEAKLMLVVVLMFISLFVVGYILYRRGKDNNDE